MRVAAAVLAVCACATAAPAHADSDLTFATYNVCKTSCGTGQFSWDNRKDAVIRNIVAAHADVVALQEVDNSYEWISGQLAEHGYAMVEPGTDNCTEPACIPDSRLFYRTRTVAPEARRTRNPEPPEPCATYVRTGGESPYPKPVEPARPPEPAPPNATGSDRTAWQAYDQARSQWRKAIAAAQDAYNAEYRTWSAMTSEWLDAVETADCRRFDDWTPATRSDSGVVALSELTSDSFTGVDDRNFAWALLRDKRHDGVFLAASVHLPNEKNPTGEHLRVSLAREISHYLRDRARALGVRPAPRVVMGDLNSYYQRQPRGAQWVFGRLGYRDAYGAPHRINADVPTVNLTRTQPNPWRDRPFRFDAPARLDYVLFNRGRALRYEVSLHLKHGRFDNRYRSSDHNLVEATLRLPTVHG